MSALTPTYNTYRGGARYSRQETCTPSQVQIIQEIGHIVHNEERIEFCQTHAGPDNCYYHGCGQPISCACNILNSTIAAAASGSPPTTPFVPRDVPVDTHVPSPSASTRTSNNVHDPQATTVTIDTTTSVDQSAIPTDTGPAATARHAHQHIFPYGI